MGDIFTGTLSDFTQLGKDYTARGQKQSLWEQFLTGTQDYYTQQTQQVQDKYSYDISQAYANYKKQQLQLQMNEKLGTGFQQQVSSQLQTQYNTTYQEIKTQEESDLVEMAEQEFNALEKGEKQFQQLGAKLQQVEKVIQEYGETSGVTKPKESDMYTITEGANGEQIRELTDIGRLWYYDVINAATGNTTFDKWLLSENSSSSLKYDERTTLADFIKQNSALVAGTITGLDKEFDMDATRTKWQDIQFNTPKYNADVKLKGKSNSANDNEGDNFEITYNNKTYDVEKGKDVDASLKTKLTDEYKDTQGSDPSYGDVMIYQGKLYMYLYNNNRNSDEWNEVRGRYWSKKDFKQLLKDLGLEQYTPTGTQSQNSAKNLAQIQNTTNKGAIASTVDILKKLFK